MGQTLAAKDQWYVVHVLSGQENKVRENNQLIGRTWYFIRNTPGVIGFAGTKDKPIPMRQSEVESMLAQMKEREEKVKPKVSFEVGESVKVADGPFQNQNGIVEEIDPE